jgi:hypothetical protein
MGYPYSGYPGDPAQDLYGKSTDQLSANGGYGLTGPTADFYAGRERTAGWGGDRTAYDAHVAEARQRGLMDAYDAARQFEQRAFVEHALRQQRPPMTPAAYAQPTSYARTVGQAASPMPTTVSRSSLGSAPVRKVPASREWIRTLGGWIMLISALPALGSLAAGPAAGPARLFIPAFVVGLVVFMVGGSLESRRIHRRR